MSVLDQADPALGLTDNPASIIDASYEVLIVETQKPLQTERLQKKLGGTIKILQICDLIKKREFDSVNFALQHYFKPSTLKKSFLKDYKGKIQFGISLYLLNEELAQKPRESFQPQGQKNDRSYNIFIEPKKIGMMIKKTLTETGASVRLVLPEMNSLSLASVAVTGNLLLQKGAEVCLLVGKDKIYTAKTLTVQDFEDYGRRDYQRPIRDEKQGMIPPKVAQIMINMSGAKPGSTILDPFCGIGTMVQEGLLLGYRMIGSDLNKFAVRGSEQNLEWFRNRYKIAPGKYGLEVSDATKVSEPILKSGHTISSVVTECTLGPIYSDYPSKLDIEKNFKDLTKLYEKSFIEFSKFLPQKARIVMCIPAYRKGRGIYEMFPSLDFANSLGYNLVSLIPHSLAKKYKFLRLTDRGSAIYDRKDQIVAREIVIFEKQ
ncbi:MAG: hypothetical protein JNN11_04840 [Candidatus Doudnabacteria bacterium]|nr:hypothetical protein [Candidatus Doudnabacteria bacterium]